jgi:hypothetical protein
MRSTAERQGRHGGFLVSVLSRYGADHEIGEQCMTKMIGADEPHGQPSLEGPEHGRLSWSSV